MMAKWCSTNCLLPKWRSITLQRHQWRKEKKFYNVDTWPWSVWPTRSTSRNRTLCRSVCRPTPALTTRWKRASSPAGARSETRTARRTARALKSFTGVDSPSSTSRGQCYKTFLSVIYDFFVISWSVCPWQASRAWSDVCGLGQELTLQWNTWMVLHSGRLRLYQQTLD
jgi:hypothetical protein